MELLIITVPHVLLLAFVLYIHAQERLKMLEVLKEISVLVKSEKITDFAMYSDKDVQIKEEEEDEDFSSYVSISDASPDELRDATINLTPRI